MKHGKLTLSIYAKDETLIVILPPSLLCNSYTYSSDTTSTCQYFLSSSIISSVRKYPITVNFFSSMSIDLDTIPKNISKQSLVQVMVLKCKLINENKTKHNINLQRWKVPSKPSLFLHRSVHPLSQPLSSTGKKSITPNGW